MIIAIPEVNPVITGAGIYETSFPTLRSAASIRIIPERNPANRTPSTPFFAESVRRIAAIAPVGPEI